jgi:hypothetical protein
MELEKVWSTIYYESITKEAFLINIMMLPVKYYLAS